ncbi:ribonuclease J [Zhenhengia yiwuensis]|uniref:ribonuclease J n=1 Tax=Zhenhengia yiwuensis TaxID=2763666 RepID=UPI002A74F0F4|nr:ribonuclease J [Zhenhengia yiwuensis]MDY3367968.1 ribonuclease J [Zhenhengia yiwuensis]
MCEKVKVIPLGGLGTIGKNITVIEYKNDIVVIDCGMGFPDEQMYGVDLIIPDITYLLENKERVKGIFFTHGHEDHIGAVPYILKQMNMPLYGTRLTLGLIKSKLEQHGLEKSCQMHSVEPGDCIELEDIKVEFVRSTHSIAGACCIAVHTPEGIIFHTGDFKVDYTPVDAKTMDLERIGELGKEGILLLLADSTNVERSGHSPSEQTIGKTLMRLFDGVKGRVIVTTFASNIHRIQQIIHASSAHNRKVAFSGRSMERITEVARELGYLEIPDNTLINLEDMGKYTQDQLTIITTGSQGEPMAALARIAFGNHRMIRVEPDDLFIISASPIPGNDRLVSRVINELYKKGVEVIYKAIEDVHVSGHAYKEELKLMQSLTHPKFFMPAHGEYRHLKHHKDLAKQMGMKDDHIFIMQDGDVLELDREKAAVTGRVRAGNILVDGIGVGDVGNIVLRDRRHLAEEGMLIVVAAIDLETYSIMGGPDVITRGFVYAKNSEELIEAVRVAATKELEMCLAYQMVEWYMLKANIKKVVEQLLYEKTKRRPTILPIIMEV